MRLPSRRRRFGCGRCGCALASGHAVSQTIIPEAQEHFLTPSARRDTYPFGGLGLKRGRRCQLGSVLAAGEHQQHRGCRHQRGHLKERSDVYIHIVHNDQRSPKYRNSREQYEYPPGRSVIVMGNDPAKVSVTLAQVSSPWIALLFIQSNGNAGASRARSQLPSATEEQGANPLPTPARPSSESGLRNFCVIAFSKWSVSGGH